MGIRALEWRGHVWSFGERPGHVGGNVGGQKGANIAIFHFPHHMGKLPSSCVQLVQGALVGIPQYTCGLWVLSGCSMGHTCILQSAQILCIFAPLQGHNDARGGV